MSKPIPWTLVYSDAPKGLGSLMGSVRVFLSPDQKTIELQVNANGFTNSPYLNWEAWIIRFQYDPKKGWQVKEDQYTNSIEEVYREFHHLSADDDISCIDIAYTLTTYAIQKKDQYLLELKET